MRLTAIHDLEGRISTLFTQPPDAPPGYVEIQGEQLKSELAGTAQNYDLRNLQLPDSLAAFVQHYLVKTGGQRMAISRRLLALIGRRYPAVYDVIPHGPLLGQVWGNWGSEVALNPQPLPPRELGAAMAVEFMRTVWYADRFGLDQGIVFNELEDWCPTVPRRPKLPPWWPPVPEPDPPPDWQLDFHLGFAARLAAASAELEGTQVGELVNRAIERSLEVIEAG